MTDRLERVQWDYNWVKAPGVEYTYGFDHRRCGCATAVVSHHENGTLVIDATGDLLCAKHDFVKGTVVHKELE